MSDSFWAEIRKIPPVTRFLCGSSLAVSVPVMLQMMAPYKLLFVWDLVVGRFELWRLYTSFFLGGSGLNYLFEFIMLYRNSDQLESGHYLGRSADYAWQLLIACAGIVALNIPLNAYVHTRPLLLALTYLTSKLAPPGSSTSLFGIITLPVAYLPYALLAMDLLMGGPAAAAQSAAGAVVGHLWWWGVFDTNSFGGPGGWASAPNFLKRWIDGESGGGVGGARIVPGTAGGVHVIPPRRVREEAATSGYSWGTGHRLGGE